MLHVTTALARRIELAEGHLAGSAARASNPNSVVESLAGGIVAVSGSFPFSKAIGLGFEGPLSDDEVKRLESIFEEAGSVPHVELCPHAHHELPGQLATRKIVLGGFENVLAIDPCDRGTANVDRSVRVSPAAPDQLEIWLNVVSRGFAAAETATPEEAAAAAAGPEELAQLMRPFTGVHDTHRLIAWMHDEPVGGVACSVAGEFTMIYGAATVPEARGRGVQTAVIGAAFECAREQGSTLAIATTLPGSTSQRTLERFGFQVIYTRAILTRFS